MAASCCPILVGCVYKNFPCSAKHSPLIHLILLVLSLPLTPYPMFVCLVSDTFWDAGRGGD